LNNNHVNGGIINQSEISDLKYSISNDIDMAVAATAPMVQAKQFETGQISDIRVIRG
jgi:hypothetical protein